MNHDHDAPEAIHFCPSCGNPVERREAMGKVRPVCVECGRVHFFDPKVAAGVFILEDGKVLLVQRLYEPLQGKWSLPAGFVDRGEDPREAARRECREETGLEVRIDGLKDVLYGRDHAAGADLMLVYDGVVLGGELRAEDDAAAASFFCPNELPDLAFESTAAVVRWWSDQA